MKQVIQLTNDFCRVLTDIERAGIPIDIKALDELEKETQERVDTLWAEMNIMAEQTLGDTPINLNSNEQLSELLFSRTIKDKKKWKQEIGFYPNQNKFEVMRLKRQMTQKRFIWLVQSNMQVINKTDKKVCHTCTGTGKVKATTSARIINCRDCKATGIVYENTGQIGGLRITPTKFLLCNHGFSSSKDDIVKLLKNAKLNSRARRFLTMLDEYRRLNNYLSTGIHGIRKGLIGNILHGNFNQASTATGRLSSSNPNLQNFPRGDTFPIKKVFTSRFKCGIIADADMAQLEFRAAAYLAQDLKAIKDIKEGIDIHRISASKIFNVAEDKVTKPQRQEAKSETFAPLYGAARDWGLLERYPTIKQWHEKLINEAVRTKKIVLPTGRVYFFPNIKRTATGCNQQTKVKNYPVQGFATADIVPAILIVLHKELKGFKSYICSTIHDSVIVDIHPDEYKEVIKIVSTVMNNGIKIMKDRFNIDINVPLDSEIKVGANAYNTKEITQ